MSGFPDWLFWESRLDQSGFHDWPVWESRLVVRAFQTGPVGVSRLDWAVRITYLYGFHDWMGSIPRHRTRPCTRVDNPRPTVPARGPGTASACTNRCDCS